MVDPRGSPLADPDPAVAPPPLDDDDSRDKEPEDSDDLDRKKLLRPTTERLPEEKK